MLRANTTNAPGARQLHELYDGSYSQSCSVLLKLHEMHEMHDSRVQGEPSQGTDIFWNQNHLQKNVTICKT